MEVEKCGLDELGVPMLQSCSRTLTCPESSLQKVGMIGATRPEKSELTTHNKNSKSLHQNILLTS